MSKTRFVAALSSLVLAAHSSAQGYLYTFEMPTTWPRYLVAIDPATGADVRRVEFPAAMYWPSNPLPWAMANSGGHIRTLGWYFQPSHLNARCYTMHPATAEIGETAATGVWGSNQYPFERDPTSGVHYTVYQNNLHRLDVTTGQLTLVGPITGSWNNNDAPWALAVDSMGRAFGFGAHGYHVDLTTGALMEIGVPFPGYFVLVRDAAFDASDQLWILAEQTLTNTFALYQVDTQSVTPSLVRTFSVGDNYFGLAFAPATPVASYCTAKTNSLGCAPSISGDGYASPTGAFGFSIDAADVRNQSAGMLVLGVGGPATTPFGGGTMCVAAPWRRTAVESSGGSPSTMADCTGAWHLDLNTWMWTHTALPAGTTVYAQWIGRDAGFAPPNNWTLSDALRVTLSP